MKKKTKNISLSSLLRNESKKENWEIVTFHYRCFPHTLWKVSTLRKREKTLNKYISMC